jgi:FkbM family methyltransferase
MYHSQFSQDKIAHDLFFPGKRDGFFVDVGAHDGKIFNNTLFFETALNWRGINVEPIPSVFQTLCQNRPNCININCAVSDVSGTADFTRITGYSEMLSGITSAYQPSHIMRIEDEVATKGGEVHHDTVVTRRLDEILSEHNASHVDLLSVDVEGGELQVFKSIDFDKVEIDVIVFECNYPDTKKETIDYLREKGYDVMLDKCDVYMRKKKQEK